MGRWIKTLGLVLGGLGIASGAVAQDGAYTELYGYGVHRYFAGDLQEAQRVLDEVIGSKTVDPRPYYFRGLTNHQLGMLDQAKADFENAARLEAQGKKVVNVSFALQRIQGPVRTEIELVRLNARIAQRAEELASRKSREPGAPAPGLVAPVDPNSATLPPSITTEPAAPTAPAADPFRDDPVQPAAPAPTEPSAPAPAADPFSTPSAPAPAAPAPSEPAPADPFGGAPAPAAPAPAAPADPFGTPSAPAPAPAPANEPVAPAPAADPFGTPAAPAPAAPAPAAPAADPFGTPAAPAPAADPFGTPAAPAPAPATPSADPFGSN